MVCFAALSILLARNAPPRIVQIFSSPAAISLADHEHRLCFGHEGLKGVDFVTTSFSPPTAASPHLIDTACRVFEVVPDGWHYNRPPPIS
jgi:hypothetical protein